MSNFKQLVEEFNTKVQEVTDTERLEDLRIEYLSKKGKVAELMNGIKLAENKQEFGQRVNEVKTAITEKYQEALEMVKQKMKVETQKKFAIDMTLPGRNTPKGVVNPLLQMELQMVNHFVKNGYQVVLGPEVEEEYYNFDALNILPNHPARDMQDSFYVDGTHLLRTHTSNSQSHVLKENPNQELKIICPGRVYRRDDDDATHSHQFMQCEGLYVIRKENLTDGALVLLKATLEEFVREIFEDENLQIRFRSSYFPFTEPSVEVDINCSSCSGGGCHICKQTGWIEILGSGVIHQNVLENAGYNSEEFTGFAFGIGIERVMMLKYKIDDIRHFYRNDLQFINQFKGEEC